MDFSENFRIIRTMTVVALLALTTMDIVRAESFCNSDEDCSSEKYCYNTSGRCVEFTKCNRYNRLEALTPAKEASECGPCRSGYFAELLGTGVSTPSCKKIITGPEISDPVSWTDSPWFWAGCIVLGVVIIFAFLIFLMRTWFRETSSMRIFEKMGFIARPTAPPRDDVAYHLQAPSYQDDDQPPMYHSVIRTNIAKAHLVNAIPDTPPNWVDKPNYEPDYNDNVNDGAAMPIHSSNTNIQIDDDEGETIPSAWSPEPTVNISTRPFASFRAAEQQDNALNNALAHNNCSTNNNNEESSSDDGSRGVHEEPSSSRTRSDFFCGPNVQINATFNVTNVSAPNTSMK